MPACSLQTILNISSELNTYTTRYPLSVKTGQQNLYGTDCMAMSSSISHSKDIMPFTELFSRFQNELHSQKRK